MIPSMAEIYRDYLSDLFGVEVFSAKPATRPPRCIVLQQIPGGAHPKPRYFANRRFLVHYWDASDGQKGDAVIDFGEQLRQAFLESRVLIRGVHRVTIPGEPGRYDYPGESSPRGQMTVEVTVKSTTRVSS